MTDKPAPKKEQSVPKHKGKLDEALDESFPASDPLPATPGTDTPPPQKKGG